MKTIIDNEEHIVVYIDYNGKVPHQVYTITYIKKADKPYWRLYTWDFFANNGDKTDIRAYNSGCGGSHKEIQAPQWVDGYKGEFWMAKDAKFKGKPKNYKRLVYAKRLKAEYVHKFKTSVNPFDCAEITHSHSYCEECGHDSTEFCDIHDPF